MLVFKKPYLRVKSYTNLTSNLSTFLIKKFKISYILELTPIKLILNIFLSEGLKNYLKKMFLMLSVLNLKNCVEY